MDIMQSNEKNYIKKEYMYEDNDNIENKVDIHETLVNLNYVKTECEEIIDVDEYKEDDDDDIEDDETALEEPIIYLVNGNHEFEEVNIKLEDDILTDNLSNKSIEINAVTCLTDEVQESDDELDNIFEGRCFHDEESCTGYCTKCIMLIRILHNPVSNNTVNWVAATAPKNILAVKNDFPIGRRVFALRTIPKNVIFGPFGGSVVAKSAGEGIWKIKNGKLVSIADTNWMEYVNCAKDADLRNLEIFQYENNLYYRTCREITRHHELLVYYGEEYVNNKHNEMYYRPVVEKEFAKAYACTFCCLGFTTKEYFMGHKKYCSTKRKNYHFAEIILCDYCKIYMEKQEYFEHHQSHCAEKQAGKFQPVNPAMQKQTSPIINMRHKCPNCPFETRCWVDLKTHFNNHEKEFKPHECDICHKKFKVKLYLQRHTRRNHSNHQSIHCNDKRHECAHCDFKTKKKSTLTTHVYLKHPPDSDMKHKCDRCPYKTRYSFSYKRHLLTHQKNKEQQSASIRKN